MSFWLWSPAGASSWKASTPSVPGNAACAGSGPATVGARSPSANASGVNRWIRMSHHLGTLRSPVLHGRRRTHRAGLPLPRGNASVPSAGLFGRAHQHLVDGHPTGPAHDVVDRVGDVGGFQPFRVAELLPDRGEDLGTVVPGQLGGDGARLDQRHAHVPAGHLLPKRLAERTDAVLGRVVDGP